MQYGKGDVVVPIVEDTILWITIVDSYRKWVLLSQGTSRQRYAEDLHKKITFRSRLYFHLSNAFWID